MTWCEKCGCGNDDAGYGHLRSCERWGDAPAAQLTTWLADRYLRPDITMRGLDDVRAAIKNTLRATQS